jgi:hypothetical protein
MITGWLCTTALLGNLRGSEENSSFVRILSTLFTNSLAQVRSTGSDPRAGTPPSVLNNTAILTSVSLYYLAQSFYPPKAGWVKSMTVFTECGSYVDVVLDERSCIQYTDIKSRKNSEREIDFK